MLQYPGYGYNIVCPCPYHNNRNFREFCNTPIPVPETYGSSVNFPYPYPESTSPKEQYLANLKGKCYVLRINKFIRTCSKIVCITYHIYVPGGVVLTQRYRNTIQSTTERIYDILHYSLLLRVRYKVIVLIHGYNRLHTPFNSSHQAAKISRGTKTKNHRTIKRHVLN